MVTNRGRIIQFINGINGVTAGGNAQINFPVNMRIHRALLQVEAVNYTGGTALATTALTGAGTGCTVDLTVINGVVTAAAVNAAGSGYTTGDTITPVDATGTGAVLTVTASAGAVTALAVTVGGTASPINPATFFGGSIKQLVNGINMRDIEADHILRMLYSNGTAQANGAPGINLGELPIYYTEPTSNVNNFNEINSWDLFGQATFQYVLPISKTVSLPSLTGIIEFDYIRNTRPQGNNIVPFLAPVAQHAFNFPIATGVNKINTIPFDYPIRRLWFLGDTPGNIYQVEIYQDGNKVLEATAGSNTKGQLNQAYNDYGFSFGRANWFNQNWASNLTLQGQYNKPVYFDAAYISDPDQRMYKALNCQNSLVIRVYSSVAQNLTIVTETLPGNYAA